MNQAYQPPEGAGTLDWRRCLLAHDLNNGLAIILGGCELLRDLLDSPEAIRRLSLIQEAACRMAREIADRPCQLTEIQQPSKELQGDNPGEKGI